MDSEYMQHQGDLRSGGSSGRHGARRVLRRIRRKTRGNRFLGYVVLLIAILVALVIWEVLRSYSGSATGFDATDSVSIPD